MKSSEFHRLIKMDGSILRLKAAIIFMKKKDKCILFHFMEQKNWEKGLKRK